MSVRDDLLAILEVSLPAGTAIIPYEDSLDVLDRMTVMFKQESILPLAAAPRSGYEVRYTLTVISPALDPAVAEADLDSFVLELLGDLDVLDWFAYSSADKVLASGHIAYDVHCWNIARKE